MLMAAPQADPRPVVLVVDDEPMILRLMERTLVEAGYRVHPASNGLRALELAASLPTPPAAMVTDLRMEPIDGADLARLMAEQRPATRVLFVSGFIEDPDHRRLQGPMLKKPFAPAQLVAAVGRLLLDPAACSQNHSDRPLAP